MNKIFKMDMHRLLHSKVFYVSVIFTTIMAFAQAYTGMSTDLAGMLGAASGGDFMASAMGAGVINILLTITLSIFVCADYSGGFAKNVFTYHANKAEYLYGNIFTCATMSAFLLILYTVESAVALLLFQGGVVLEGGIIGLLAFLVEKWLLSCGVCSLILTVLAFTRNMAWGIFGGFVVSTGGLSMGLMGLASILHWNWLNSVYHLTLSGASSLCTTVFDISTFARCVIVFGIWFGVSMTASLKILSVKDI